MFRGWSLEEFDDKYRFGQVIAILLCAFELDDLNLKGSEPMVNTWDIHLRPSIPTLMKLSMVVPPGQRTRSGRIKLVSKKCADAPETLKTLVFDIQNSRTVEGVLKTSSEPREGLS